MRLVEDQMELIARLAIEVDHSLVHAATFSEEVEGDIGRDQPAANQEHDLDHIRQRHHLQSSVYRIDTGKGRQPDYAVEHRDPHHLLDRQGSQVQDGSKIDKDEDSQPEDRHHRLDALVETLFEELGHGEDLLLQKDRDEELRHEDQSEGGDPFVGRHRQPDGIAGAGHADKLFGGDIGSDDRSAYRPPGKPAPGEEIIAGIPLVPLPAA